MSINQLTIIIGITYIQVVIFFEIDRDPKDEIIIIDKAVYQ